MNSFIEKYDRNATLVIRAFAIAKRTNRQLQARELTILRQAVDVIIPHLVGTCGMTSIELEVLLFHAAVINPDEQLDFLDTVVEIITATRPGRWLTEYDTWFLEFVSQLRKALRKALTDAQEDRQGGSNVLASFTADSTLQASVPVLASSNSAFQAWSGNTSQMANLDVSILSGPSVASCWNISSSLLPATETLALTSMVSSGGAQTPCSMLISSSTPSIIDNFTGTIQNWHVTPQWAPQTMEFEANTTFPQSSYLDSSMGLPETQAPGGLGGFQYDDFPDWLVNSLDYDHAALIASIHETNMG